MYFVCFFIILFEFHCLSCFRRGSAEAMGKGRSWNSYQSGWFVRQNWKKTQNYKGWNWNRLLASYVLRFKVGVTIKIIE